MTQRLPIIQPHAEKRELPTVEALSQLWEEVSAKPLYAPPNFFTYLKLRYNIRLKMLDPTRVRVRAPHWKTNACSDCTDICCIGQHSTVQLRLQDIATLVDIGRQDLMTHHKPQFDRGVVENRPALRRTLASQCWQMFPVLKQTSYFACQALTVEGKCSLYPHWPLSCARFPYSLDFEERAVFYSRRCDSYLVRSDTQDEVDRMTHAAVAAYNERIKDLILLHYAKSQLSQLGLTAFLHAPHKA